MDYRDKDYIKATTSVPSLLESYGIQIRHGRCRGFCHGGRDMNMAVKQNICHCFVCNQSFDCFGVVMFFEGCDFNAAFEKLGGKRKESFSERKHKERVMKKLKTEKAKSDRRQELYELIAMCDAAMIDYHQTVTAGRTVTDRQRQLTEWAYHNYERLKYEYDSLPEGKR